MPRTKNNTNDASMYKITARKQTTTSGQTGTRTTGNRVTLVNPAIIEDKIRIRAYSRFLERGCSHGNDMADWLVAEKEVKKEFSLVK